MFGLSATASAKLARLLLEWSDSGQFDKSDMIPHLSITHEQIGEFIGASRETVSRILAKFRNRQLVAFDGSTLTIPDRSALVSVAGY
jgi:CRP-like cAMP-binding protein